MSTHTRPALRAAVRTSQCAAFWTDVFCVPRVGPERQATLENMGYIYSRATEVIIVLSEGTFSALQNMAKRKYASEADLKILERDEWVSSVWTYQELVNAAAVRVVSEQDADTPNSLECSDFFNALGHGLVEWEESTGSSSFDTAQTFPNVTNLETILADWQIAAYTSRSAFGIFTSMSSKRNSDPANYFYAILGALTDSSQQLSWDPDQNLADKIMGICEGKPDFSFIYTVAARDSDPHRRWRPYAAPLPSDASMVPAVLRPILAWHNWGEAQRGYHDTAGLWLEGITTMTPAPDYSAAACESMARWLGRPDLAHGVEEDRGSYRAHIAKSAYDAIRKVGFEGDPDPIVVSDGLVFTPQTERREDVVKVLVSNQIRWSMGAPGLVQLGSGGQKEYLACAFIGSVEKLLEDGETVLL